MIVHSLSKPKIWSTWKQWDGRTGRLNSEAQEWFIQNHPPIAQNTEYYICDPGAMNIDVRKTLLSLGIPKEMIHIEHFAGSAEDLETEINAVDKANLVADLNGHTHQLVISKGKTILEVLKEGNVDPPYSCESGVCGTCVAKIVKGKAEMKSCMALEDHEIEDNFILTCQALPMSEDIELKF